MSFGSWLGAAQHEDPVRVVRVRRPDLLAVDHPPVAVESGLRRDAGQVRARARFGVALAPQLLETADPGQEAFLLFRSAERDERRAQQPLADDVDLRRRVRLRVLLVEDDLLLHAALTGPAEARPPVGRQVPVPPQPALERLVLAAGSTQAAQLSELTDEVGGQPFPHLAPEGLHAPYSNLPSTCFGGCHAERSKQANGFSCARPRCCFVHRRGSVGGRGSQAHLSRAARVRARGRSRSRGNGGAAGRSGRFVRAQLRALGDRRARGAARGCRSGADQHSVHGHRDGGRVAAQCGARPDRGRRVPGAGSAFGAAGVVLGSARGPGAPTHLMGRS